MKATKEIAVLLAWGVMTVAGALAQDDPGKDPVKTGEFKVYRQRWTPPAAPHVSRVKSCENPVPDDRVAMDDFQVPFDGTAVQLRWWGAILDQDQIGRPYYVAIYSDIDCEPGDLLYETCVVPTGKCIAVDCSDHKVARFQTPIPAFEVHAGEHYWLQISEDDADSANVGQDDFLWSGRQPRRMCPAMQLGANGQVEQPLIDACNGLVDDLSFELVFQVPVE